MVWQPIETAPKDGAWFLAFVDGECRIIQWYKNICPHYADAGNNLFKLESVDRGYWMSGKGFFTARIEPSFWMPLPQPPQTKGK